MATGNYAGDVLVAGTFDTKGTELHYIRDSLISSGVCVHTVDLSTSGDASSADVPPGVLAAHHPEGAEAVFSRDRGQSIKNMSEAFAHWIVNHPAIGGVISAGGSGGTALATPAMQALPIGVPKIMVSTVASGEVGQYVGASDIMMMYSVTDVQGLNSISRQVLANAAHAMAGMANPPPKIPGLSPEQLNVDSKPTLGITMFGVTTIAVQQIMQALDNEYDCLVFHATGTGGRSMEKLADSGRLDAVIDLTTTEVADKLVGGVFAASDDRFCAFSRQRIPYIGSLGALDMVNFHARATVPEKFSDRLFVEHNPQVTLMRTTIEENRAIGIWIAQRLNQMTGPVRFLIPEGGVSVLDAPGQPFHDPAADAALFDAIESTFKPGPDRVLTRLPHAINDAAFAKAVVSDLHAIHSITSEKNHGQH